MLQRSSCRLPSKSALVPIERSLFDAAGTNLPGIPHTSRVPRLYRQWLKLAVECPPSRLAEANDHAQMNERLMVIIRQKFREGATERDPDRVRALVISCERSLAMFRELAADGAKRKFPEAKPRLNLHKFGFLELGKINYHQMAKEYWNSFIMRKW